MLRIVGIIIVFLSTPALADQIDRRVQAIPALIEQRNGAMDAAAVCVGDLQSLQKENAALKAENDQLKKQETKKGEDK